MEKNIKAFLDTIAYSEGTAGYGDNGYNVLVGGHFFDSYADHPRIRIYIPKLNLFSTAAGRYQLLARYYDAYKKMLKLSDFSPPSQDAIAIQQIKERDALIDIIHGDINSAICKCSNIWASFPNAGYGQHENKLSDLRSAFTCAGGITNQ